MEFLEGVTLADWLAHRGALAWREAESLTLQLCQGLQAVHLAGVIHRDLKSRNIMVVDTDHAPRAVIMDFGMARDLVRTAGSGESQPGAIVGTPEYMAPEQFESREVTSATDIYALRVVMYELLTGRDPFESPTPFASALQRSKRRHVSSIQPGVPRRWDTIIERCLEYEREIPLPIWPGGGGGIAEPVVPCGPVASSGHDLLWNTPVCGCCRRRPHSGSDHSDPLV